MPPRKKLQKLPTGPEPANKRAKLGLESGPKQIEPVALPYISAARHRIKLAYCLDMPEDFYHFWCVCCDILPADPLNALGCCNLLLVGPFEVLYEEYKLSHASSSDSAAGSSAAKPINFTHWRFYFDPPEFLTVIVGDRSTQYHIGYFRDEPSAMPAFVASNEATSSCNLTVLGDNLFAAAVSTLSTKLQGDMQDRLKSDVQRTLTLLTEKANAIGLSLSKTTPSIKARDKLSVSRCFHGAGIVVPVTKDGVGYRPIPESPQGLRRIFKEITEGDEKSKNAAMDELQELITYVQFANDECDYGEGLELGLDLFCFGGSSLHPFIKNLLPVAYQLLGRPLFAQIIEAHLESRKSSLFAEA